MIDARHATLLTLALHRRVFTLVSSSDDQLVTILRVRDDGRVDVQVMPDGEVITGVLPQYLRAEGT